MTIAKEIAKAACCPGKNKVTEPNPGAGEGVYQGKVVKLNDPQRGGSKKFFVYTKNPEGRVIKVSFGDPNGEVANHDPKRAASFRARHKCSEETDKTSPNWWSCNVHKFWKQLGLSSNRPW
jgi:hypothetical protein